MKLIRVMVLAGLGLLTGACGPEVASNEDGADIVFTNGAVYTVDETVPWAEAVAITGTDITYV